MFLYSSWSGTELKLSEIELKFKSVCNKLPPNLICGWLYLAGMLVSAAPCSTGLKAIGFTIITFNSRCLQQDVNQKSNQMLCL